MRTPSFTQTQTKLPDPCWDKPVSGLAWVIMKTQHFWGALSTAKQVYSRSGCTPEVTLNTVSKLKYLRLCACPALLLKTHFRYNRHLVFSLSHKHDSNPRVTCTLWNSSSQSGENVELGSKSIWLKPLAYSTNYLVFTTSEFMGMGEEKNIRS